MVDYMYNSYNTFTTISIYITDKSVMELQGLRYHSLLLQPEDADLASIY